MPYAYHWEAVHETSGEVAHSEFVRSALPIEMPLDLPGYRLRVTALEARMANCSPEAVAAEVVQFAREHDCLAELCDYVEYDPDIGRIPGRWEPKIFVRLLAEHLITRLPRP